MFVCCECCVLSGRGLCDELITRPEESYRLWWVVVSDLETSRMRRPWPALGRIATKNSIISSNWQVVVIIVKGLVLFMQRICQLSCLGFSDAFRFEFSHWNPKHMIRNRFRVQWRPHWIVLRPTSSAQYNRKVWSFADHCKSYGNFRPMKPGKIKYTLLPATVVEGFEYKWEWYFL